jgi:hypothetical protein
VDGGERGSVLGELGGVQAAAVMLGIGWIVVGEETTGGNGIMATLRIWARGERLREVKILDLGRAIPLHRKW